MRPIDRTDGPSSPGPKSRPPRPPAEEKEPQDGVQLSRSRTASGRFRVKRGDTKLKTLRETYGLDFAAGLPGNMPLAILRAASGLSLSQMLEQPEKLEEATEKVKKEKTLVRLYQDSPGAGGGYPPESSALDTDSPGAGGGYPPYQSIDSPGAGGGYPPADTVDSPGAGGGYPPYQSVPPGKDPAKEPAKEPSPEPEPPKGPSEPPQNPA